MHDILGNFRLTWHLTDEPGRQFASDFDVVAATYEEPILIGRPTLTSNRIVGRHVEVKEPVYVVGPKYRSKSAFRGREEAEAKANDQQENKKRDHINFAVPTVIWHPLENRWYAPTETDIEGYRQAANAPDSYSGALDDGYGNSYRIYHEKTEGMSKFTKSSARVLTVFRIIHSSCCIMKVMARV